MRRVESEIMSTTLTIPIEGDNVVTMVQEMVNAEKSS